MTTANVINIAKVCIPLALKDITNQANGDKRYPRELYIAYNTLNDLYTDNPSSTDVTSLTDYVYTLCGGYYFQAQNLLSLGQSGIIVNPSTGIANLTNIRYQFLPTDVGALVGVGGTIFTINIGSGSVFQDGTFQIVVDNVVLPRNNNNYFSYTVSYAAGVITVTLNQAALATQLYIITGTYLIMQ